MKKQHDIISWAINHSTIIFLLAVAGIVLGIYGLIVMPKQEFPLITIRQGLVIGVFPGHSSDEVDDQLTQPLENFIFGFEEVNKKKTMSQSRDGFSFITVELNDNIVDKEAFWSKFKHRLTLFKSQLPSDVLEVIVNDDFGNTSSMLLAIESDDKTYREMETYADELEKRLRSIKSVSGIQRYGGLQEQISVYLDADKLAAYAVNENSVAMNLASHGFAALGGSVETLAYVAPVHLAPLYDNERNIAEHVVYSDPQGNVIRLKDIARIVREYPAPSSYITNNGRKCLLLSLEMGQGYNVIEMGREVNAIIQAFQNDLPDEVTIERIVDQSQVVGGSVKTFLSELLIAIGAVIIVIILLLPLRVASIAASTIPMTIFLSLGMFFVFGLELNTVTLAALIVSLGIIVDDSIVIIDNYMERLDEGLPRREASIVSAKGFFKSIFSATLAISVTFFPFLATTTGVTNDFVKPFPPALTIILFISLLVAILIIPFMQEHLIKSGYNRDGARKKSFILNAMQSGYERLLCICFAHPYKTITVGVLAIGVGALIFFSRPMQLMPIADRDQFAVEIYMPHGTAIERTAAVADSLEHILRRDKRVKSVTSFIGTGSPRFHAAYAPQLPGSHYAQFIVNTTGIKATEKLLDEYADVYDDYFPGARIRFKQLEYNDIKYPVEVRLSGDDLDALKHDAEVVKQLMYGIEGLKLPHTNFEGQLSGVKVVLNEDEINRLGISPAVVSANITMHSTGLPVAKVWERDYPLQVVLYCGDGDTRDYESMSGEYISAWGGSVSVPLRQIATILPDWHDGQIVRRNGILSMSVFADMDRGYNAGELTAELSKQLEKVDLSEGVSWSLGGSKESDAERMPQVISGLLCAAVIIFVILLFHFGSIKPALLILSSTLFCILGAGLGLCIMHIAVSITAILGVVTLMGILVRNGIIMLDYAEELQDKTGMNVRDAAYHAAVRRMRPIFLTSSAAAMGVIPMILGHSSLWSPMGTVIFFGTLVSMLFTLTVLPILYWQLNRKKEKENMESLSVQTSKTDVV